jgi:integrase
MSQSKTRKWPGGFVRTTGDGRPVFYIHKRVAGRRWKKALDVGTESEALAEFVAFNRDPAAFCAGATEPESQAPLYLDAALVGAYKAHAAAPRIENGRQNGAKWLRRKIKLLQWWAEALVDRGGRALDLRRVDLAKHVLPPLEGVPGARHRREAIKALYSWLAATGKIKAHEDPVARLPVGQGRVAQTHGGIVKVVPREHVLKVIDHLAAERSRYADALVVQAGTGWHTTEVERFVRVGEIIDPVPVALREPGVVAVLSVPHKSGKAHYSKVAERVLRSARALHAGPRGLSIRHYDRAVRTTCVALGLPPFTPAWMRHTNATHAVQQRGVSDLDVGKFLGHADASMVHAVYGVLRTPPKVPTILDEPGPAPAAEMDAEALAAEVRRLREENDRLRAGGAATGGTPAPTLGNVAVRALRN